MRSNVNIRSRSLVPRCCSFVVWANVTKKKKKWRCRRQVGVVILTINLYSVCMCGKGKKTEKKEKKTSLKKRIPWRKNKVIFPPRYTLFCFFFYTSPCGGWGGWWWWWWTVSLQPDKQRLEFWNRSIIFNCFSFLHLSCRNDVQSLYIWIKQNHYIIMWLSMITIYNRTFLSNYSKYMYTSLLT